MICNCNLKYTSLARKLSPYLNNIVTANIVINKVALNVSWLQVSTLDKYKQIHHISVPRVNSRSNQVSDFITASATNSVDKEVQGMPLVLGPDIFRGSGFLKTSHAMLAITQWLLCCQRQFTLGGYFAVRYLRLVTFNDILSKWLLFVSDWSILMMR